MRRLFALFAGTLLALGMMAGPAVADYHGGDPDPHDHKITVPGTGEDHQVGPKVCDRIEDGAEGPEDVPNWRGFVNFHDNVHQGEPDQIGRGSGNKGWPDGDFKCGELRY